ncbi:hypothetical protein AX16_008759 [Volvariella volvacea WC 439]|nr:hypothetical protein AX16_008759 [Volvariella volvacea WC 439]
MPNSLFISRSYPELPASGSDVVRSITPWETPQGPSSRTSAGDRGISIPELASKIAMELQYPGRLIQSWTFTWYALQEYAIGVDDFIKNHELYKKGRWVGLPTKASAETSIYKPLISILQSIIQHFNIEGRAVHDTSNPPVYHRDPFHLSDKPGEAYTLYSKPDIMVLVVKEGEAASEHARYDRCYAPIEVKRKSAVNSEMNRLQLTIYARQCFSEQPNRYLVFTAIITESTMMLFQFNRGGIVSSESIDIHAKPEVFVKWCCGIMSDTLGFDKSMQYDSETGRWYLETVDGDGKRVKDAVAGHRNLYVEKGFLHCDIHMGNVRFGPLDASVGNRGVIIDFKMAVEIDREQSLGDQDIHTGDPLYHSCGTILNPAKPHDHFDDLESF